MPGVYIGTWPGSIKKYHVVPWELTSDRDLFRYPVRRMSMEEMLSFDFLEDFSGYMVKTQFWMFPCGVREFVKEFTKNRFGDATFCLFRERVPGLGKVISIYDARTKELIAQRIERL